MALTIETGSGVAGANSYISVADTKTFAAARGITLPADGAAVNTEVLLIRAMDYIEALRADFQGTKTEEANALQWPRTGVQVDGFDIDDDEIPACLPLAQAQLACDAYTRDLMPVGTGREVVMERVEGAVERQYAQLGDTAPQPILTAARALLAPLLKSALGGGGIRTVRV